MFIWQYSQSSLLNIFSLIWSEKNNDTYRRHFNGILTDLCMHLLTMENSGALTKLPGCVRERIELIFTRVKKYCKVMKVHTVMCPGMSVMVFRWRLPCDLLHVPLWSTHLVVWFAMCFQRTHPVHQVEHVCHKTHGCTYVRYLIILLCIKR